MRRAFGTAVYGLLLVGGGAGFAAILITQTRGESDLDAVLRGGSLLAALFGIGFAHRQLSQFQTLDKFTEDPWDAMTDEPQIVTIYSFALTTLAFGGALVLGLVIFLVVDTLGNLV